MQLRAGSTSGGGQVFGPRDGVGACRVRLRTARCGHRIGLHKDRLGLREDADLLLSRGEQTQTYEGAILMDQHIGDLIVTDVTIVSRHVTGLTHVKPGGNLIASGGAVRRAQD